MSSANKKLNTNPLYLIFHGRFPSEKAASIFAAESCQAFAGEGRRVTLLVPRRFGRFRHEDPYTYYNVPRDFHIVYLPTIDLFRLPLIKKYAFHISFIAFSLSTFCYLLFSPRKSTIYSNEHLPLYLTSFIRRDTFYELHDFPESGFGFFQRFYRRVGKILAHNRWKRKKLSEDFDVPLEKIFFEPNAVSLDTFENTVTKEEARKTLELPMDKKLVVYTGHLYGWKGTDTLARAARNLPRDTMVIFVGGSPKDVERLRRETEGVPTIRITGHRKHEEMPLWQKAADVLALPNTAKENISKYYTSPMKLFEYMASERPVVASDIPSITEIVDHESAMLVEPDNHDSLASGILRLLDNPHEGERLSRGALDRVRNHTWSARAGRILSFMEER